MRLPHALLASLITAALSSHLIPTSTPIPEANAATAANAPVRPLPWSPPPWLSGDLAWSLPQLDGAPVVDGPGPKVRARGAIVADLDRGEVLWARNADTRRGVASLTKLFAGLTLAAEAPEGALTRELCVSWEQWPVRPGATSRFVTGACHDGWQLAGAALVRSDNRGAMAMPALAGLPVPVFAAGMNAVAADLGMDASFTEPSGLDDDNRATPRAVLKAVVATAAVPTLAHLASAPMWTIDRDDRRLTLGTTNRLVERFDTLAAKTGYTDTARHCFTGVFRLENGREVAVTTLGAHWSRQRWSDVRSLLQWVEKEG